MENQAATTPSTVLPGYPAPDWTPPVKDRDVPGALLLGPDGKVIATNLHGTAIQAAVAKALGPR